VQTSWIAGSVFVGFLVYVTVKGELPAYKDAIFGPGTTAPAPATQKTEAQGYANQDPSIRPVAPVTH